MLKKEKMLTKTQFLQQLDQLVQFQTVTGNQDQVKKAFDYIVSLISAKAKVKRLENNGFETLLAFNQETKKPEFGYMVHLDVVSATSSLFKMRKEKNKVFGRGVSDMKFSIPIGISLLNELIEKKSATSFCLIITSDEEIGGFNGGKFLADEFKLRPLTLIVPDGGDNLLFVNKSKGVAQFEVTAKGSAAHASRPWQGKNALPKICQLVNQLEKKYGVNSQKENWNTTLNFGQLTGGISTNQVCDLATLKIDFRYPETDSLERIELELRQLANQIDKSIQITRLSTGLPTFTDTNLPVVKKFLAVLSQEFGQQILIQPNYGASDARHFARFITPVLMIKPVGGDIHCDSEWLDVDSTMKFSRALQKFILKGDDEKKSS